MLEMKERKIGACSYRVRQLTVPIGRPLLTRLFKVFGPAVGAALVGLPEGDGKGTSLADLKTQAIGDAITVLADSITEKELEHICDTFTEVTLYSREPDKWLQLKQDNEFHWSGRYLEMFQWLGFALEVNYADFLGGSVSLNAFVSAMQKDGESQSPSQKESTGNSTESLPAADTQ